MQNTAYDQLREERLDMIDAGECPEWYTTGGYQMFKAKYQWKGQTVRSTFERIAKTLAKHVSGVQGYEDAEQKFFDLLWKGWLSPSTPVLSNTGTDRGLPVSCSGQFVDDSIHGFYSNRLETALLTKYGFGTSAYLGSIRPRGSSVSDGTTASGPVPVFAGFCQDMRDVSQGAQRRGAFAGYFSIDCEDFDELINHAYADPDDCNIGWCINNQFVNRLRQQDPEAVRRFQVTLKLKLTLGIGYYFFTDKVNNANPEYMEPVLASNLCSEITLPANEDLTYTCVLSSMNVARYHEWKETDAVYWATIFLDCVAQEFLNKASKIRGLEKAVKFTRKYRALGLGVTGYCTYLQDNMIPYESLAHSYFNQTLFNCIKAEAVRASASLLDKLGPNESGQHVRNSHLLAVAPTKSTALLMGGVSEGINPDPAMTYTQLTPAGEVDRVSPVLLKVMKQRGVYNKDTIQDIVTNNGSVQHVSWLTSEEKAVFKTAFEINQEWVLRTASQRQRYICQSQSLNLFFAEDEDPRWIGHIHKLAFEDPNIKSLYYIYSKPGIVGSKECSSCQ